MAEVQLNEEIATGEAQDPAFANCIAAFQRAESARDEFYKEVVTPATEAFEKACAAIPHVEIVCQDLGNKRTAISTAQRGYLQAARTHLREFPHEDTRLTRDWRKLIAADDQRLAREEEVRRGFRINELDKQLEVLTDDANQALDAVEDYPVTSVADLIVKLEILQNLDVEPPMEIVFADLRRIEAQPQRPVDESSFDPGAWMAAFDEAGATLHVESDGSLSAQIKLHETPSETQGRAAAMLRDLLSDPDRSSRLDALARLLLQADTESRVS